MASGASGRADGDEQPTRRIVCLWRLTDSSKISRPRPLIKWCADINYIATGEGWLYLAIIIDLYSRLIVGWTIGDDLSRQLVLAALTFPDLVDNRLKQILPYPHL
jgi:transposase InsO family protein